MSEPSSDAAAEAEASCSASDNRRQPVPTELPAFCLTAVPEEPPESPRTLARCEAVGNIRYHNSVWCSALTEVSEQRRQVQLLMAEGLQGKHDYAALLKLHSQLSALFEREKVSTSFLYMFLRSAARWCQAARRRYLGGRGLPTAVRVWCINSY